MTEQHIRIIKEYCESRGIPYDIDTWRDEQTLRNAYADFDVRSVAELQEQAHVIILPNAVLIGDKEAI